MLTACLARFDAAFEAARILSKGKVSRLPRGVRPSSLDRERITGQSITHQCSISGFSDRLIENSCQE